MQARVGEEFLVAVDSDLGEVFDREEGAVKSTQGNEGRIAQAWVNVRGGLRVLAVNLWHSEGWTPKNEELMEAVVKQAITIGQPWPTACDANMDPEDVSKSWWFIE